MTSSGSEPPLNLLSLDGGGIRGMSEILVLKEIMHRLMVEENKECKRDGRVLLNRPRKPCEYFDLIGGTSTGGIIAIMLGRLRMDVDQVIECYNSLVEQVFSERKRWGDGKFKATTLEAVIKSVVQGALGDSESPLFEGDVAGACRTFVCARNALNMSANIPVLFRTYQSHETHSGCRIWEAARATSAAPTFFKRIEIGRKQPFIDGGLGRNNPSRVVLDEARAVFGKRRIGCLVSIGTGQAQIIGIERPGLFQQIVPINVIEALRGIATDCESTHEDISSHYPDLPYFRLNVEQGMQQIRLSEWERLDNVEANTAQYMRKGEVVGKLDSVVEAIIRGRPMIHLDAEESLL